MPRMSPNKAKNERKNNQITKASGHEKLGDVNKIQKKKHNKSQYFRKSIAKVTKVEANAVPGKVVPKTSARLPGKPEEASSNWKSLLVKINAAPFAVKPLVDKKKLKGSDKADAKDSLTKEKIGLSSNSSSAPENIPTDVWFDNVDPLLLEGDTKLDAGSQTLTGVPSGSEELTKSVALDCEMVGVGPGGVESALARISIVNHFGKCVYDKFVKPGDEVTDYRTQFSGIRPHNLKNAVDLGVIRHEVSDILRGRILIGHGLRNDLEVLMIKHPKPYIRDTSKYKGFREVVNGATPSLKLLSQKFLGIEIQSGEHSSVQDAQAAMRLYTMFRQNWETDLSSRRKDRKEKMQKVIDKKNKKAKGGILHENQVAN